MSGVGVYADNAYNRKVGRVGKPYGSAVVTFAKIETEDRLSQATKERQQEIEKKDAELREREESVAERERRLLELESSACPPSTSSQEPAYLVERRQYFEKRNLERQQKCQDDCGRASKQDTSSGKRNVVKHEKKSEASQDVGKVRKTKADEEDSDCREVDGQNDEKRKKSSKKPKKKRRRTRSPSRGSGSCSDSSVVEEVMQTDDKSKKQRSPATPLTYKEKESDGDVIIEYDGPKLPKKITYVQLDEEEDEAPKVQRRSRCDGPSKDTSQVAVNTKRDRLNNIVEKEEVIESNRSDDKHKSLSDNQIVVTGLPNNLSKDYLKDYFGSNGMISKIEFEAESGRALVTYEVPRAADTAVKMFDGYLFHKEAIIPIKVEKGVNQTPDRGGRTTTKPSRGLNDLTRAVGSGMDKSKKVQSQNRDRMEDMTNETTERKVENPTKNAVMMLIEMFPPPKAPQYKVTSKTGPVDNPTFTMVCTIEGQNFSGEGKSIKEAKLSCSQRAVEAMSTEKDAQTEIRRASGSYDLEEGECEDSDDGSLEDQSEINRDAAQIAQEDNHLHFKMNMWYGEKERMVFELYSKSLDRLTFNSRPVISTLSELAGAYGRDYAPLIVRIIEDRIERVPPELKLIHLYLLDSIVKNHRHPYAQLFQQNIVSVFRNAFLAAANVKWRGALYKLRETWGRPMTVGQPTTFSIAKLNQLDHHVNGIDPQWPIKIGANLAGVNSLPTAVTTQTTTVNRTTAASIGEEAATTSLASGAQQQAAANLMRASQPAAPLQTTSLRVPTITAPASAAAATTVVAVAAGQTGSANQQHQGSVCMVYGLNSDKMNAARIFNLFCLYGNVVRIKFLCFFPSTKKGCAMVQMSDALAVERVVSNLNNTSFFGSKMHLIGSNQAWRQMTISAIQPFQLPDGTPSFQDYTGCMNNRFINPEMASKNRILPPTKILQFFNTPVGLESEDIEDLFSKHSSPKPKCIKVFLSKTKRSSWGLIEFQTLSEAVEALVCYNHLPVPNPTGKFPYIMKLCFAT